MSPSWILLIVLASLVALVVVSFVLEALRRAPQPPRKLAWAPDVPIQYVDIGGMKLRYIKTGAGSKVVLPHTLRTQLDLFEKVVPGLARYFTASFGGTRIGPEPASASMISAYLRACRRPRSKTADTSRLSIVRGSCRRSSSASPAHERG